MSEEGRIPDAEQGAEPAAGTPAERPPAPPESPAPSEPTEPTEPTSQRVTIVGWRNWGDHPYFVVFTVVATVTSLLLAYLALGDDEPAAKDPCVEVVGRWDWLTVGGIVAVAEGGTITYHPNDLTPVPMFTGTWDCDARSGDIAMRWNTGFSDKLRLSDDGSRLRGTNDQNGSTVSAVRAR